MSNNDNYIFLMHNRTHSKSVYKWIMDSGATKHMTSYKDAFDIYEVIVPRYVHFNNDSVVKAIEMRSILVEAIVRRRINRIYMKDALYVSKLKSICFH